MTELDRTKQQTQQQVNSLQTKLDAQTKELDTERQSRIAAERRLPDITTAINLIWPAQQIVRQLQGAGDVILISAPDNNKPYGDYLINLLEMTATDLWINDKSIERRVIVRLPDYQSDLDAPHFQASNYSGISIHGAVKYIGNDTPFRGVITDLFARLHFACRNDIGWTQKSTNELTEYYKRNVIWIEIGSAPLPKMGGC